MHKNTKLFHDHWEFLKSPLDTTLQDVLRSDLFLPVSIPHDFLIEQTYQLYESCLGWYKKTWTLTQEDLCDATYLYLFDGVYMDCTIYINGKTAFTWKYGYSPFSFDATPFLQVGENQMIVCACHEAPNSRWYSGAGIYRNVYEVRKNLSYIPVGGVYIHTLLSDCNADTWEIHIQTTTSLNTPLSSYHLGFTILDADGLTISTAQCLLDNPDKESVAKTLLLLHAPTLWDTCNPYLYSLQVTLWEDNRQIDCYEETFGLRTIVMDPQKGFLLNGVNCKIFGACQHHDLGCLGSAVNADALRRQLVLLQDMGVNAIRTSHNMPARELLHLCDELGLLVVSEAFDMWEQPKTTYDYARFFLDWYQKDVKSWVLQGRNHPCVILWSIGNEIPDTHISAERGIQLIQMLTEAVRHHDPLENAKITFGSNYMAWENTQLCAEHIPVVGYNYAEYLYHEHHRQHPHWVIYGSETASTVQSRGIYHFPYSQSLLSNDDMQCSSLGNCTTCWGAKRTESNILDDLHAPFSLGQFIWTGWDYFGEPTPYFTRNSYLGQIDTAGFPKDAFYIYQSAWLSPDIRPMIHILPYWDHNPGQLIDIRVFSNASMVELFLNDQSVGRHTIDHQTELSANYQLPYQPGTLTAIAYHKDGHVLAQKSIHSFGDPAVIQLAPDRLKLLANGTDLAFVTITCLDNKGNPVENARNRMHVSTSGSIRLIGLDNGDSTDFDAVKGTSKRLFSGKLLAVIAATHTPGEGCLVVTSNGLPTASLAFFSQPANIPKGANTYFPENKELPCYYELALDSKAETLTPIDPDEICIRKIELHCQDARHLTNSNPSATVKAHIFPSNATHRQITWQAVNNIGLPSPLATLEETKDPYSCKVLARGDGAFRLRAIATNHRMVSEIISDLEFEVSGYGVASLNPYQFVYGSLYNCGTPNLLNGIERGIASASHSESCIGFSSLDFGDYGSDKITIPFFFNSADPLHFSIWEGLYPEESAIKLCDATYHIPSIWNTYQEMTFKLPRRLRGTCTLSFVFHTGTHMKGFQFTYYQKALQKIDARDYSHIAGDRYIIDQAADRMGVYEIGNNVTILYDHMDFEDKIATQITICGQGLAKSNPIRILMQTSAGTQSKVIEFTKTATLETLTFPIEPISGSCQITFLFMPGSHFDLEWFQFS